MATQVKAKEPGFYNGQRKRAGAIFTLKPGHKPGKWMEVLGEISEPKAKEAPKKEPDAPPETLAEVSKTLTLKRSKDSA